MLTYVILEGGRCSVASMNSPVTPEATAGRRISKVRGGIERKRLTVLEEALQFVGEGELLRILSLDLVDEVAKVGARRSWRRVL